MVCLLLWLLNKNFTQELYARQCLYSFICAIRPHRLCHTGFNLYYENIKANHHKYKKKHAFRLVDIYVIYKCCPQR